MAAPEAHSRIFAGLDDAARAAVLDAATARLLKTREVLAEQGAPATTFYIVQVGHLKLSTVSPDGREIIARFIGPGDPYAGVVLLGHPIYPISATAVEPSRVLGWPRGILVALADRFPQLRTNIVGEIAAHMTDALDRVQELTTERVSQRLARTLLRLAEHGGHRVKNGIEIAHPVTRQELADLVSTTLFSASRMLARWEDRGLIESARGHITILRPRELQELAEKAEDD